MLILCNAIIALYLQVVYFSGGDVVSTEPSADDTPMVVPGGAPYCISSECISQHPAPPPRYPLYIINSEIYALFTVHDFVIDDDASGDDVGSSVG